MKGPSESMERATRESRSRHEGARDAMPLLKKGLLHLLLAIDSSRVGRECKAMSA
jgi:hypothetical protein